VAGGEGETSSAHQALPHLRLDDLLDELQARIEAIRSTRDRIRSLLEAVLAVGRGLELEPVLHRIVETAATLVDARRGLWRTESALERLAAVRDSAWDTIVIEPLPPGLAPDNADHAGSPDR